MGQNVNLTKRIVYAIIWFLILALVVWTIYAQLEMKRRSSRGPTNVDSESESGSESVSPRQGSDVASKSMLNVNAAEIKEGEHGAVSMVARSVRSQGSLRRARSRLTAFALASNIGRAWRLRTSRNRANTTDEPITRGILSFPWLRRRNSDTDSNRDGLPRRTV